MKIVLIFLATCFVSISSICGEQIRSSNTTLVVNCAATKMELLPVFMSSLMTQTLLPKNILIIIDVAEGINVEVDMSVLQTNITNVHFFLHGGENSIGEDINALTVGSDIYTFFSCEAVMHPQRMEILEDIMRAHKHVKALLHGHMVYNNNINNKNDVDNRHNTNDRYNVEIEGERDVDNDDKFNDHTNNNDIFSYYEFPISNSYAKNWQSPCQPQQVIETCRTLTRARSNVCDFQRIISDMGVNLKFPINYDWLTIRSTVFEVVKPKMTKNSQVMDYISQLLLYNLQVAIVNEMLGVAIQQGKVY